MRFQLGLCSVVLFLLAGFTSAQAAEPLLKQIKKSELSEKALPGYSLDIDQVFRINAGPLKANEILFATKLPGEGEGLPKFVVARAGRVVDSKELPTLEEGWNLVAVQAVSAEERGEKGLRIFAVLTLEPLSGRSDDYWEQGFVFDLLSDGKIETNNDLNQRIAKTKPRIKSIKELKKFTKP